MNVNPNTLEKVTNCQIQICDPNPTSTHLHNEPIPLTQLIFIMNHPIPSTLMTTLTLGLDNPNPKITLPVGYDNITKMT